MNVRCRTFYEISANTTHFRDERADNGECRSSEGLYPMFVTTALLTFLSDVDPAKVYGITECKNLSGDRVVRVFYRE